MQTFIAAALAVSLGLSPSSLPAGADLYGKLVYTIRHDQFGEIGTHTVAVAGRHDGWEVEVRNEIAVRVLLWTHREETHQMEVWRGGRLVSFQRVSGRPGGKKAVSVTARAAGDKLMIEGPSGRAKAPGYILSSHPWNPRILDQKQLMFSETGELKKVTITLAGEELITVGDTPVRAHKYKMTGGLRRELWYDEDGLCVQVRLPRRGGWVTVTLATQSDAGELAALRLALRSVWSNNPSKSS